jgi:titin
MEWSGALAGNHVLTAVATDDDGAQTLSDPVHITATPSVPAAPSNLVATSPSAATIALSWRDNSINEESFVLQRSEDGINWVGVNTFVANTTSNNNRYGVVSGRTYFYRIRARNSVGYSAYAYSSAVTAK